MQHSFVPGAAQNVSRDVTAAPEVVDDASISDRLVDLETAVSGFDFRFSAFEQNISNLSASISSLHGLKEDVEIVVKQVHDLETRTLFASKTPEATPDDVQTRIAELASVQSSITAKVEELVNAPSVAQLIGEQLATIKGEVSSLREKCDASSNMEALKAQIAVLQTSLSEIAKTAAASNTEKEIVVLHENVQFLDDEMTTMKAAFAKLHSNCEKRADSSDLDALKRQITKVQTSIGEMIMAKKSAPAPNADERFAELESKMTEIMTSIQEQQAEQQEYAKGMTTDIRTGLDALQEKLYTSVIGDLKEMLAGLQIDQLKADMSALKEDVQATATKKKPGPKKRGTQSVIEVEKS
ncbi:hypothetical protein JKP88DRAFT_241064 [Tribonema minus]|uniref:Uncharacterized protein n=1 Tax=Tribonema minus TaxID=303371 RepID=A0A835Z3A1_9STRA|nr:hypothetical protein JKP88DRAFT_241064 [Tribonema minus]